ncbi:uncharacterized protein LOC129910711 [Episyrphus balteatus]|uniref:uncharacterized protein LOC129910711 n=1 Tax=Episyrphus balteatus TaxID=286459 RepID=UPI002485B8C9|nr:uncharacterized protein LOC129910711 [Episyrphus balteatus]
MCGIFAIFSKNGEPILPRKFNTRPESLRQVATRQSQKQRHRGPDFTGVEIIQDHGVALVHERVCIVGVHTGHQPFRSQDGTVFMIANGEIYNYLEQAAEIAKKRGSYQPKSDCNVIIELYEEYGENLFEYVTGMFAIALYDTKTKTILLARDPFGIISMYYGEDEYGNIWVSSEMKCLVGVCRKIENFPPGVMRFGKAGALKDKKFFQQSWQTSIPRDPTDLSVLRQTFISAVRSHLHCDCLYGALLSGGVDSSLVASIATKIIRETDPSFRLKTFSVGLEGAPDFKYSRMVADYIDSDHTDVFFTIEQGIDCIRDIIFHLETYDVTTVRCSIPMLLLTRYIKSTGIKMILSGEGADEIFGGYLYFFNAPDKEQFHQELVTRVMNLCMSDCLRANKVSLAKGVELRVPFLDTEFVNYAMSIRPEDKIPGKLNSFEGVQAHRIEKHILRKAFGEGYLPDEVLWRQKEQFSDGVGYNWIDTIRGHASSQINDDEFAKAAELFPINTPTTKEAFYYREIFEELFPGDDAAKTVKRWVPRQDWGCPEDPSGRAQAMHAKTTEDKK